LETSSNLRLNVAVIGAGIAGLSTAWLLSGEHKVTLFEADPRLGGHAHTADAPGHHGTVPVDTGFIVYNEGNYPNFTALLDHLDVPSLNADMSLSVSLDDGAFEYSSFGLGGVFAQKRNLLSPRFWRLLLDISRFFRTAPRDVAELERNATPLDDYLKDKV
jgi:predicted NAD/FAD-binding protein